MIIWLYYIFPLNIKPYRLICDSIIYFNVIEIWTEWKLVLQTYLIPMQHIEYGENISLIILSSIFSCSPESDNST